MGRRFPYFLRQNGCSLTGMAARPETPVAFVRAILRACEQRGVDPGPLLRHAGLRAADLRDPDGRVALEPFEALSALAMRALDDEALGWFGRPLPWGSYGMLLRASLTAPTLEIALRRWCRHHGLLTGDVRILPEITGAVASVRVEEAVPLGVLREFCLVSLLRNLHGVACWLVDSRIPLIEARFPFAPPRHVDVYGRLFRGTIVFGAGAAEVSFDAGYLRLPVVRDDAGLRRLLQRPIPLMARPYRQDRLLSQRVAGLLAVGGGEVAGGKGLAGVLGMSERSLQRHLQAEGTSLGALTVAARHARAEALLARGDLPLKRVAQMLGYSDASSFGRAFRGWTGLSPAAYRQGIARARGAG